MRAAVNRYRCIASSSWHHILNTSQSKFSSVAYYGAMHEYRNLHRQNNAHRMGLLLICGVGMGTLYAMSNTRSIIIADVGREQVFVAIRAYQSTLQQYARKEQYEEMIDYLRKEIMRLSTSSGKYNEEIVDFLENKLCANLCVLGRCDEAIKVIERYSERELIDKQCILRAAFVYHAAERFEHAIHLFELMKKYMDQQLENKFNKARMEKIKKEVEFTVEMHLAECYTQLNEIEKAKHVYSELNINDIIKFQAAEAIADWFQGHGTQDEFEGFQNWVAEHKRHAMKTRLPYE